MINDRPPRDVPSPIGSQDDTTRGAHVPGRDEDAPRTDFPGNGLSELSLLPEAQEECFSTNTRGSDPSSSSYKETVSDTVQSTVSQKFFPCS